MQSLEPWLSSAMKDWPQQISDIKLTSVRSFAQTLRRYTSLNHLAQVNQLLMVLCLSDPWSWGVRTRVSSKQTKINFGSNRNKPKQDLFRVCFGLFRETKTKNFGLFRCFEPILKQPKQTELFHNQPKQP